MTSSNFAAAQKRVLERRRLREAESHAQLAEQQRALHVNAAALEKLPYPLRRLPESWLSLWNSVKGREGMRPAFRVGQVDAELLDEELLALLKGQVGEALKYFGVRKPCSSNDLYSPITDFSLTALRARRLVS